MIRLIDANALKEAIRKRLGISSLKYLTEQEKVIVEEIDNAPTVKTYCYFCGQTEHGQIEDRPQGKWVKIFDNPFTNGYVCPFCGHKIQVTEQFLPEVTECEGCGANMEGGAE